MANNKVNVKSERIRVNVEDTIYEAFKALCSKDGITESAYGRKLILQELMVRQMLPNETLLRLTMG